MWRLVIMTFFGQVTSDYDVPPREMRFYDNTYVSKGHLAKYCIRKNNNNKIKKTLFMGFSHLNN
jgi:hypothetical protein